MKEQLLQRFLTYTRMMTPSNEESTSTPSTTYQFGLAKVLVEEMKAIGISGAHVDEHCYVYGYLPATEGYEESPCLGFLAHIDTVSDFCTKNPTPVVHENYDGGDLTLPSGRVIAVKDYPHLALMKGRTLITSDGTTVLGADDKAGIAEIMTLCDILLHSDIPHGKISIAFTPDEEIGSGAELLDLELFGADFAYTADGDLEGGIEYETFNGASAKVEITGVNVHPGAAKDIMINAAVVGSELNSLLPVDAQPRTTCGYEGFFHLVEFAGTVEKAVLKYIIRDHDTVKFQAKKALLEDIAKQLNQKYGADTVVCEIKDSYYNMAEILKDHMHLVDSAIEAAKEVGLTPSVSPVRGGTDGARLSFRGLPCPNFGTGGAAFHGPYEHISLEGMEKATQMMIALVKAYAAKKG